MFGIFSHTINDKSMPIVRGFDDMFYAPHSRHTEIRRSDVESIDALKIVSESPVAGVYIVVSKDHRQVFITGHSEYDPLTLKQEFDRDRARGLEISLPENYFPEDNPERFPQVRWRSHSFLLFSNWLNYYVYQETPFDISSIH